MGQAQLAVELAVASKPSPRRAATGTEADGTCQVLSPRITLPSGAEPLEAPPTRASGPGRMRS